MQVLMTVRSKGLRGTAERFGTILGRFGLNSARMESYLRDYSDIAAAHGARPTLPITAVVLERHAGLVRRFSQEGVEFAIHGLVHNDHAGLSLERQTATLKQAAAIFDRAGVPCVGFRGPYLRFNAKTDEALRAVGLSYHSSQAVVFRILPAEVAQGPTGEAYRLALKFYGALDADQVAVRPWERGGLVHLPVAVPDDEILVDRLHFGAEQQSEVWLRILEQTHSRGELFTVQLHAERIPQMRQALELVLRRARQLRPAVWLARLDEIAAWWRDRREAVVEVTERGPGSYQVHVEAPGAATVLIQGSTDAPVKDWQGSVRQATVRDFSMAAQRKPVISVSTRTAGEVRTFLREEGFCVETAEDPSRYGAHIDLPEPHFDEQTLLQELSQAPGPLVRLWRWPNGAKSAMALTGDIDSITLWDFGLRLWETRQ